MELNQERIDALAQNPSESLNVEIKNWIDPKQIDGEAKIAKCALALRNRNGGYLVIGFNDKTLEPEDPPPNANIRQVYNNDLIQEIVSRYAHDKFEISIGFARRDGMEYPVIGIPEGIRVVVAAKRDLVDNVKKHKLISLGDVYFRSLQANGIPSSTRAKPEDWSEILRICFDNQEADIGRFLRRQLGAAGTLHFAEQAAGLLPDAGSKSPEQLLSDFRDESDNYRLAYFKDKNYNPQQQEILNALSWTAVLLIHPEKVDAISDNKFINTITGANPNYTGWPVWVDTRNFREVDDRPIYVDKLWQAYTSSLIRGWGNHADFMRFDAKGRFYLWRLLQDDFTDKAPPGTALEPIIVILRVAEAIAVGLSFARALGWSEDAILRFGFRWSGLKGRVLKAWGHWDVHVSPYPPSQVNEVNTYVEVPAGTPVSAISPYVSASIRELFLTFGGYEISDRTIENWVQKLIERQL